MPRLCLYLCLLFLGLLSASKGARAQVVNIEQLRIDDRSQGWSGSVAGDANIQSNQNTVVSLGFKTHAQYRRDSSTYLLVGETGLVKASGAELVNFAFSHLRYTYSVTPWLDLEAFTQLQQNRVNGIASRWLLGAGPRFLVFENPAGAGSAGFTVMREREREIVDSVEVHRDIRLSAYVAGSYTPESADWITASTTTYFQPRIGRFADIRIVTEWRVEVRLRTNLSLVSTLDLNYDARPPIGLRKTIYAFRNGLRFRFS